MSPINKKKKAFHPQFLLLGLVVLSAKMLVELQMKILLRWLMSGNSTPGRDGNLDGEAEGHPGTE